MQKKRKWAFVVVLIVIAGLLLFHFYIPRFITETKNPLIVFIDKISEKRTDDGFKNGKEIEYYSEDSLKLKAWLTPSKQDSIKGTLILLHGIRSSKKHFKALSERLSLKGFNAVAIDLRAHGASEGIHCTFGVKEKFDIKLLISHLIEHETIHPNIGIWGQSLGGAVGLQVTAIDERVKFAIIESTFSNFREITHNYLKFHSGFNIPFITNYLLQRSGKIADFNTEDAAPAEYCKGIQIPILIAHGNKDKRINIKYGRQNFRNIKSTNKYFYSIENANHINLWKVGGEDYFKRVFEFIELH